MKQLALALIISFATLALFAVAAKYWGSSLIIVWAAHFAALIFGAILIASLFSKKYSLAFISIFLLLGAIAYPLLAHRFHLMDVALAKKYVSDIAPALEDFKKAHGSYPDSLRDLNGLARMPPQLEYGKLGDGFYIIIPDPQDIDCDRYDSNDRIWRRDN